MEVYVESLATKGCKRLDRLLTDLNQVTLKLPQRVTVDSGQVKHTQDNMGLPEQLVFAYQHNAFDAGNFGKVDGHNHYRMVDFDRFEYTAAHYLQIFVAQILRKLVGIAVVDITLAMLVKPCDVVQYWMFDQDEG